MERIGMLVALIDAKMAEGRATDEEMVTIAGASGVSFEFENETSFELKITEADGECAYHVLSAAEMRELSKVFRFKVDNYEVYVSGGLNTDITVFYTIEKRV